MKRVATYQVLYHSSIRIAASKTVYFDPYQVRKEYHDADVVFVTHDHFDHYSPEDIVKVSQPSTVLVIPETLAQRAGGIGLERRILTPGETVDVLGMQVTGVPAYTIGRPFHPKEQKWLGYLVELDGTRYYVAGDTDNTPENNLVFCDVAFLPVGGKYTMNVPTAAALANAIHPQKAIPTHYGTVAGTMEDGKAFASLVDPDIQVEVPFA